ncbi:MAG: cytochrome c biogenesis protein CcsA [Candidatus Omnitrophota bacterium]|nr:cytochrome c biogenesis protein CcsA [Candidatus Omnitrophota bacterium]
MIFSHVFIIFASYAAFVLALLTGVLFLAQESRLKRKDPTLLASHVVPLEVLDRINLYAVVAGFTLFSAGMLTGSRLARLEWGSYFNGDPKELWSLVTWGAYAAVLALRLTRGLRGRRVVFLSVMSFALLAFTFFGVNYLTGTRHAFIG